ncbi:MAG: Flagellar hook-associated protein 2 [Candidatus Dichloromethanomonas elyunquensis]|nr:MAG: Flagellar hook-associated protein 2 [Candidatus Dichloromethanomonas elyunquensis]
MSVSNINLAGISGYDFSSIVDAMTTSYSQPLDRMKQTQTSLETTKNAWRDVNTRLSALENTLTKLRDTSTWASTSASSGDSNIVSATSSAGAVKGTYNIKVTQMALAQTAVSTTQSVDEASSPTAVSEGLFRIAVGDDYADIAVSAGEGLDTIAASINNAKIGVQASVIKVNGGYRLALISSETGTENAAAFSEISGNVLHTLGILNGLEELNVSQDAQDAKITVNGIEEITSSANTVTTAISGMILNLNQEAPDTTVTIKVSSDFSQAQQAVQSFISQYNSVMSFIEDKLKYDKDTGTKGDLFADPVLQGIQSRLREMVSSGLNNPTGSFDILADVGISTSSDDFGKSASLVFDTAKFTAALDKNADSVANLFGSSSGGVDPVTASSETQKAQGLANIMKEYLHPMVMYQGTLDKTANSYDEQIKDMKERIQNFQARIDDYTERVKLRFSNLETQLSALDSQNQWLTSQIASMSSSNSKS